MNDRDECGRYSLLRTIRLILLLVTLPFTSGAFAAAGGARAPQKQAEALPNMDPALSLLKQAQSELQKGASEFGGHREAALQHVSTAVSLTQSAIDTFMKEHPTAVHNVIPPEPVPTKPGDPFPHMDNALRLLQKAQTHLNEAFHQYHGKREEALNHVNAAIAEIQKGEEYARAHATKK
jgi:hypothetical protein